MTAIKVLICSGYGMFGLSRQGRDRLRELGSELARAEPDKTDFSWMSGESYCDSIERDDPLLIQVFQEVGQAAAGHMCHLKLVEIPAEVHWHIAECDGLEWVAEDHRTWD